jgi:Tfp pilus assembly protein PilE
VKQNHGITLVSLVITIIVLIIITGIAIFAGTSTIKSTKIAGFMTELELIQEKVNTIYEKRKLNKEDINYYSSLGQNISIIDSSKLANLLNGVSEEGYYYFSKEDLKKLELDNISQEVIINFETRDVASINGILVEDKMCYRLIDFPSYRGQNVDYTNKNTKALTFDVEVTKLSNSWQIFIKNIINPNQVYGGTLSYKLDKDEEWIFLDEVNHFEVTKPRHI